MKVPMTPPFQPRPIHTTQAAEQPGNDHILETTRKKSKRESQFAQLPPEVLLLIIEYLDMAERISLLMTCSYLRRLSEPLLYRHLGPDGDWKSHRRIQLLTTLRERQDLLLHIHSFRGRLIPTSLTRPRQPKKKQEVQCWDPEAGLFIPISIVELSPLPKLIDLWDSEPTTLVQDEWFAISAPLFLQAINIRELEFTDSIDWQANDRWGLFKNAVSNMKLRSLAFSSTSKGPLDLQPILRGQPELTRLELTCPTAHFDGLRETDVPKLKIFKGTWRQAAVIVPGRPVERLDLNCVSWSGCQCLQEQIFQRLLQSSETIREFKTPAHRKTDGITFGRMLQLIIQYLPQIVDFTMTAVGEISAQDLLDEIPKLSMIRSLKIDDAWIIFTDSPDGVFSVGSSYLEINSWGKLRERLKELCPSLSDVEYTEQIRSWCGTVSMEDRDRWAYL